MQVWHGSSGPVALAGAERHETNRFRVHLGVMARFYMHICNGAGFVEDEEGIELRDEAAARERAVEGARDVMAGEVRKGELDLTSFIEVEDEDRKLLFTLTFADAVEVKARH